jgi:polyhydroxyalkanoate synthase
MTKPSGTRGASDAVDAALDVMLTDAAVGGRSRFVRPGAALGVAAGLVRRPGRAARRVGHLGEWLRRAATRQGRWWTDYDEWRAARSGELKPAPKRLGGQGDTAQAKAPGTHVHAR